MLILQSVSSDGDGARNGSIDISINKAFTARAFGIATKELAGTAATGEQDQAVATSAAAAF